MFRGFKLNLYASKRKFVLGLKDNRISFDEILRPAESIEPSVAELNRTHPKILAIENNRRLG